VTGAGASGTAARRELPEEAARRAGQQSGVTGAGASGTAARRELPEEVARAGQQPGLTGAGVSGTAARRELPEEVARAGQQPGLTGAGVSGTAARPDRLRGEQPGQTGSCPGPASSPHTLSRRCHPFRRDPPTIVAIREERLRREAVEQKQNAERERAVALRALRRMSGCSPDSRHSGRNDSESVRERCSERSLSPLVLGRLARQETADLPAVRWENHLDWIDPRAESIACIARQAILGATSFYVGVTRYPRRRWLGGDHLTFEKSHSSRWETMHVLSTHSHRVGDAEDALIRILRKENGERCTNIRGGGGGASPYKTKLLYVCVP
jgi:hypothetical protein